MAFALKFDLILPGDFVFFLCFFLIFCVPTSVLIKTFFELDLCGVVYLSPVIYA